MTALIDQYLDSLFVQGGSADTIRAYRSDLHLMQTWLHSNPDPTAMLETRVAHYITANRSSWEPRTTLRKLAAMRGWQRHEGNPDFLKAYRPPRPEKQEPHPIPEGIPGLDRMLAIANTPSKKALLALCGFCGLRVSEACAVMPTDIDLDRMLLRVRGKGDKTRFIPISVRAWSHMERAYLDGVCDGTSLVRIQQRGARASITSMARRANLRRRVASHDLRATFATAALDATKDLLAVQQLLGHADPATTQIYTSVSDARKREAVEAL